jgi:acyl-CoA hydrolase
MIAVDDNGRPTAVPALPVETAIERKRHRAAELRRDLRREFALRLENASTAAIEKSAT